MIVNEGEADALTCAPYLADIGVMALVPDEWGGPWQPRHQILTRLSRYFNVVFCTPARWWRHYWSRGGPRNHSIDYGQSPPRGFTIYRPPNWLPEVGRPAFLARWTSKERLRQAHRILLSRG